MNEKSIKLLDLESLAAMINYPLADNQNTYFFHTDKEDCLDWWSDNLTQLMGPDLEHLRRMPASISLYVLADGTRWKSIKPGNIYGYVSTVKHVVSILTLTLYGMIF